MGSNRFDAIVVGGGPNGLAAAIVMQQAGVSAKIIEGCDSVGGGMRSAELTLPGYVHDICSAVHPLAADSPFFKRLPLEKYGLEWIYPGIALAHALDGGEAAVIEKSLENTAARLGGDGPAYIRLIEPFVENWDKLASDILGPLRVPRHPVLLARFGLSGIQPASTLARRCFATDKARALVAGLAAHSMMPIERFATSAIGMVLAVLAHTNGWAIPRGGSQKLADALTSHFLAIGGTVETGRFISSLDEVEGPRAVLLDLTPKQILNLAGDRLSRFYRWQLGRYRYGPGVFKVDWALSDPIPFTSDECREAGTVHLGGLLEEVSRSERSMEQGVHPDKPFVLLAQQSVFDSSRAPEGNHTAWGYCHVPHGSDVDMTRAIEAQIERFAPGFMDTITARHVMTARDMQEYNPNYVGGDINGGIQDIRQMFTRPSIQWSPYSTSIPGVYICSSSTPPGGGVHGMCGYHAAREALKRVFRIEVS